MKKVFIFILCSLSSLWSDTITVGYNASSVEDYSKKDITISANIWIKAIAKDLKMGVKTIIYDEPKEMMKDLKNNKVDYVTGFGLTFIEHFDLSLLDNGFSKGFFNGEEENFVILVQKNSGIKSLADLKNVPIGIQKSDDIMRMYLNSRLTEETDTPLNLEAFSTRQRVLFKLFFKKIKAAIVTNKTFELAKELNPQMGQKLKILHKTNLQATGFGFLRRSLEQKTKEKIIDLAKEIHKNTRGRQLLTLYKTELIVDSKLEGLKPFEDLYKQSLNTKIKVNK